MAGRRRRAAPSAGKLIIAPGRGRATKSIFALNANVNRPSPRPALSQQQKFVRRLNIKELPMFSDIAN